MFFSYWINRIRSWVDVPDRFDVFPDDEPVVEYDVDEPIPYVLLPPVEVAA